MSLRGLESCCGGLAFVDACESCGNVTLHEKPNVDLDSAQLQLLKCMRKHIYAIVADNVYELTYKHMCSCLAFAVSTCGYI